ncbi:bidirectional sugar transporter SWEET1 isoform X2 [Beta vulgaris subsp. vulgaris]|uniref:bidirectional sugar transporter SWEET1 isoform X2 n=1 Tax=Beta vulgaris subsp. vulgaris TaxID=3555 RepID=UPI0020367A2C|nr:bidirectional sugar transporter SWEET1 isoform X2 [Beta vulgaris subsp. vulgaris]
MNIAHFIFGVFGNATALFLFLAPVVTFKRIIKNKSTEQFSGIPYVMTLLNNLLSAWYGLPFVSPNNILVTTINGTGAVIESVYVLIFLILAPRKEKVKIGGLLAIILSIFAIVALVSLLALHDTKRKVFCGVAASVFSIIMYGSPLSIMVPNGFGSALGAMQLILYFIYYDKNPEEKKKTTTDHGVELGLNGNGKAHHNIQDGKSNTQPSINGHV